MAAARIVLFCIASLGVCFGLALLLYPHARLPAQQLASANTPQAMEDFDTVIDLGDDYGPMTVIELMAYYLENPPAAQGAESHPVKRKFGGC